MEEHTLFVSQEIVAPVDQRAQRLLARKRCPVAAREQAETVGQPRRDLLDRERAAARGGQLERKRDAIKALADSGNRRRVVVAQRERRLRGNRALDEQARSAVLRDRVAEE